MKMPPIWMIDTTTKTIVPLSDLTQEQMDELGADKERYRYQSQ
jgi:hypothetical protein